MTNLKDLAKDIATHAVSDLIDGKNVGEVAKDTFNRASGEDTPEAKAVNSILGIVASFLGGLISKLFK